MVRAAHLMGSREVLNSVGLMLDTKCINGKETDKQRIKNER